MLNHKKFSEILSYVYTEEDLSRLLNELENLKASLDANNVDAVLKNKVRRKISNVIKRHLQDADLKNYLDSLMHLLSLMKEVRITLAFEPSQRFVEKLYDFFYEILKKQNYYLKIIVDPKILGGIKLEYGGKYIDLTLKAKIDKEFKNKKEAILNLMKA